MTTNSYSSQLTPDELQKLTAALLASRPNMVEIQAQLPPWRDGPHAGSQPSLRTLYTFAAQLRSERHQEVLLQKHRFQRTSHERS